MELRTMNPASNWEPAPGTEAAIDALGADDYTFHVWGGDWCIDCRSQLPDFGAALDHAGVDSEQIEHYPVEKEADGSKNRPGRRGIRDRIHSNRRCRTRRRGGCAVC